MRLSVPCNWDPALLEKLSTVPDIYEMTAAMNTTPVGGGRSSLITNRVDARTAEAVVDAAHRLGWRVAYLLNAPCMGNMEFDVRTHRALLEHLDWLATIGVDSVTLSIPYLIELVKTQYPMFRVKVSVIAGIDSLPKVRYLRELGADSITLDYMKNRDLAFLSTVVEEAPGDYWLLANEQCLFQCPFRRHHYAASGHSSQSWDPQSNYFEEYNLAKCLIYKLREPERLLMMPWIRPEDLSLYEAIGLDAFKLSGRHMATDAIVRAVEAYASRRYDGNLMEILNPFVGPEDARFPKIDNRCLDGFLSGMATIDCDTACGRCRYCSLFAKKAIRMDDGAVSKHLSEMTRYVEGLKESGFLPTPENKMTSTR